MIHPAIDPAAPVAAPAADMPALPAQGLRSWLLRRLCERLAFGSLTVVTPEGGQIVQRTGVPGPEAVLVMHRWRALSRLLLGGDIGAGESYMNGDWSSPDLTALIELAALNDAAIAAAIDGALPVRLFNRMRHAMRANTPSGSRRNIVRHYDLGNAFYARWLDRSMTYSAALYRDDGMTLEAAQAAKQQRIIELLDVEPSHDVLEIGFGWGGLVGRLAALGCRVTGLTLSPAQHGHAQAQLAAAGLADRTDLRLEDYRRTGGFFDRIVSIEMLEAVGEAYWPRYFEALRARLRPGGVAVLQVITIADERFESYRRAGDFVQRYIFPGGMLPSPAAMRAQIARAGLALEAVETFGTSYARTLREWHGRFLAAWPEIAEMGFSPRFRRMWEYYLCYCEAGFRAGTIDVGLWRLAHAR